MAQKTEQSRKGQPYVAKLRSQVWLKRKRLVTHRNHSIPLSPRVQWPGAGHLHIQLSTRKL